MSIRRLGLAALLSLFVLALAAPYAAARPREHRNALPDRVVLPQERGYTCGAASLANALRWLGYETTETETARLASTCRTCGTDEKNLMLAARHFGFRTRLLRSRKEAAGERFLERVLAHADRGEFVIAAVDDNLHWLLVMGTVGDRVAVADPARTERTVLALVTRATILGRLYNEDEEDPKDSGYYGLALVPHTAKARKRVALRVPLTEEIVAAVRNRPGFDPCTTRRDLDAVFGPVSRRGRSKEAPASAAAFLQGRSAAILGERPSLMARRHLEDLVTVAQATGHMVQASIMDRAERDLARFLAREAATALGPDDAACWRPGPVKHRPGTGR